MQVDTLEDPASKHRYGLSNEHIMHPQRQLKSSDGIIDTSKLLFKPLALPQQPRRSSTPTTPRLRSHSLVAVADRQEQSLSERPPKPLIAIAPQLITLPSNSASQLHMGTAFNASMQAQGMLTIARPASQQSKPRSISIVELITFALCAVIVTALYLVIPLITTLIPIFSVHWSRIVMAVEILAIGEFLIYRILVKTTRRSVR